MLGDSTVKNYIKNNYALDVKPRVFLEFNGNDIGSPYFYGTGTNPSSTYASLNLSLSASNGGTVSTVDARGIATGLSNDVKKAQLIYGSNPLGQVEKSFTFTTLGPVGVRSIKFNMFLKSDYAYQISNNNSTALESFNVILKAYGLDSSNKVVTSEIVTKSLTVDSVDWLPVTLSFANPDDAEDINRVKLEISIHPTKEYSVGLLVGQLIYSEVSPYEVFVENRLPVKEVFETNRPGEFLIDMPLAERPTVNIANVALNQQCSPLQMCMSYAIGPKYENMQRSVAPFEGNPYSYYVSGSTSIPSSSQRMWCLYQNKFKTNKIVLKINSIAFTTTNFAVKILTSSGWSSTLISSQQFDNNGILTLYYNGTAWTTTKWSNHLYPRIRKTDGQIYVQNGASDLAGTVEIHGIYFECNNIQVVNADLQGVGASTLRLEMIEISPRLEIDVTDYLESFNIIKELDSSDSVLPIGNISSNSAKISLSNIPITRTEPDVLTGDTDPDIPPISNFSSLSPIKGMLKKGAKVRGGFDVDTSTSGTGVSSSKVYIPAFTMYVDEWSDNDSAIEISAFDIIKNLQTTLCRPVYMRSVKIPEAIRAVLDPIGFGDYYYEDLSNIRVLSSNTDSQLGFSDNEKISHFWTSKDSSVSEVLQDLARVYQIAMYADEYGAVRFKSLYQYSSDYKKLTSSPATKSVDLYVQDKTDANSLSNLESVDFVENEKPQSISIKYKIPQVGLEEPGANTKEGKNPSLLSTKKESTKIVWTLQEDNISLPYIAITGNGILGVAQNYIPYSPLQSTVIFRDIPYSSLLLIDTEIVSYNGKEYEFTYKTSPSGSTISRKLCIIKQEDIDMVVRNLMANESARYISYGETGKLMNVQRGLYGTTPTTHTKTSISGGTRWRARQFTKSSGGYKNSTAVSLNSKNFSNTEFGIQVSCADNDKIIYVSPNNTNDNSDIVGNKKRLSASFNISDIPNTKEGYLGVALGVTIDGGDDIDSGLIVWFGKQANKNKKEPVVFIEQIVNGNRKTLVAKDEFEYSERLFEEGENLEVFISINDQRDECMVLIGGTSAFARKITVKPNKNEEKSKDDKDKKEYKNMPVKLVKPLPKSGSFGIVASNFGSGILGQFLFGASKRPDDMNDLNIYNLKDDYAMYNGKTASSTYFIGENNLLENIVSKQLIPGFNDSASDNFTYTATPVARGMRVFEVDYDTFPVTSTPKVEFLGYTYKIDSWQAAPLFTNKYSNSEDDN
jgi:hypothetical protein